jgi:hypothetical protein
MTRVEIYRFFESLGWRKDRIGILHKNLPTETVEGIMVAPHRIKMLERSLRFERKLEIAGKEDWFTIYKAYYGHVVTLSGNKIQLGKHTLEA